MDDTLKLQLNYIDKNGKNNPKLFTVKISNLKDSSNHYFGGVELKWEMYFSLVLPEHYVELLKGKTVPTKNENRLYPLDLKKTIKSETIKGLCEKYNEIVNDYKWCLRMNNLELTKVLFFNSESKFIELKKSLWDGTAIGPEFSMNFRFAVGYIDGNQIRYNHEKIQFQKNNYTIDVYNMTYVKYTEDRYVFFQNLIDNFKKMEETIKNFSRNLTEENIEMVINNPVKLIG